MKENHDTLYDIIFAEEKRYQAQKIRERFDWQIWQIHQITAAYRNFRDTIKNIYIKPQN